MALLLFMISIYTQLLITICKRNEKMIYCQDKKPVKRNGKQHKKVHKYIKKRIKSLTLLKTHLVWVEHRFKLLIFIVNYFLPNSIFWKHCTNIVSPPEKSFKKKKKNWKAFQFTFDKSSHKTYMRVLQQYVYSFGGSFGHVGTMITYIKISFMFN